MADLKADDVTLQFPRTIIVTNITAVEQLLVIYTATAIN